MCSNEMDGMDQPGGSTRIRSDADTAASQSLTRIADGRRTENIAAAALIHEIHALSEIRLGAEMDVHLLGADHGEQEPNVGRARHTTECEAAVALSLSRTVVRQMITVANQLAWRLPAIDEAFTAGDLDYPRVRTIALTLHRASDSTVTALEADILAAALRCNPKALKNNIWKLWILHDPDEAAAAQNAAVSEERCADVRRGDDGIATLIAKMTMLEGAECDAILEELAGTVCPSDPRTRKQLRGHALLALFHREESLTCMCGNDMCPVAAAAQFTAPRRKHLLNIHIDIDTLLGLNDNPATLSDGTVLDPDIARLIATDARWQLFLTDMLDAAHAHPTPNNHTDTAPAPAADTDTDTAPEPEPEPVTHEDPTGTSDTDTGPPDDQTGNAAGDATGNAAGDMRDAGSEKTYSPDDSATLAPDTDVDTDTAPVSNPDDDAKNGRAENGGAEGRINKVPRARRLIARGRTRPPAPLPTTALRSNRPNRPAPASLGGEVALSNSIADFLAAAAADPTLTTGHHPDGHGGHHQPPPGALTYRPCAELVALTRATHSTCTFPSCSVPAARCDIDHIVPFDHDNPHAGGWTILSNLQPLCSYHHHAKTLRLWACAKLDGNGIYWRSGAGLHRITPPTIGTVTVPDDFVHHRRYRQPPATNPNQTPDPTTGQPHADQHDYTDDTYTIDDEDRYTDTLNDDTTQPSHELYEPTWWETNMTDQDTEWYKLLTIDTEGGAPTLGDIARLTDPQARDDAEYLRNKFLEHRAIIAQREKHRPPPF